jgi:hypothetical protein
MFENQLEFKKGEQKHRYSKQLPLKSVINLTLIDNQLNVNQCTTLKVSVTKKMDLTNTFRNN